ncbi:MAG: response regulator [Sulfurimonadaceae bacterium]|nr:response regulator [Sulfurimonadaceae bacterium]
MGNELGKMRERVRDLPVLIVEDEAPLRESTVAFFSKVFDRVVAAANGEEALEHWAAEEFEVVISDIKMPGISGIELLNELRRKRPDLITIIFSGDIDDQIIDPEKVDLVLLKPVTIEDIKSLLECVIRKKGLEEWSDDN